MKASYRYASTTIETRRLDVRWLAMDHKVIRNMRARSEQCRRLAGLTHDEKMKWQVLEWANDIDADIRKLQQTTQAAPDR